MAARASPAREARASCRCPMPLWSMPNRETVPSGAELARQIAADDPDATVILIEPFVPASG